MPRWHHGFRRYPGRDHLSGHSLPDRRPNTERPITVTEGTNRLVQPGDLVAEAGKALRGEWPHGRRPDRWDGQTAARCVASLKKHL